VLSQMTSTPDSGEVSKIPLRVDSEQSEREFNQIIGASKGMTEGNDGVTFVSDFRRVRKRDLP